MTENKLGQLIPDLWASELKRHREIRNSVVFKALYGMWEKPKPLTRIEKIKIRAREVLLSQPLNWLDGCVHRLADYCGVNLWRSDNYDDSDW